MEEKIITLVTSSFQHAQVLKNILETEGIECFLQNVNVIEGAVNMGVKVRIKESDLEAAIKIIESIEESGIDRFREKKGEDPKSQGFCYLLISAIIQIKQQILPSNGLQD